ncbi:hypothetical protein [Nonomuraea basaltis]|uniref:hypothetical protein n=1 Tax=Nonomuraea basaltis TaxID=2495887 RepID=UPI0014868E33|nr:hypothetical protein [Nonomuraea basaltis]
MQYLRDDVAALCRGHVRTEHARQQLLSAAARAVHWPGGKPTTPGQQGLTQHYATART